MNYKSLVLSKLDNVIEEIKFLKRKRFSSESAKNALRIIEAYFKKQKQILEVSSEGNALREFCAQIQDDIEAYMAIIGVIANSSSVRNIFEMYEPLWLAASSILEPQKKPTQAEINLIIATEWHLSPFVFSGLPSILKDFILIGLPASEASNPLIVPLAGHELGHIVWRKYDLLSHFGILIKKIVSEAIHPSGGQLSLLESAHYPETYEFALRQAEEMFCDIFGMRIFKKAYVYAFFYLLFPWRNIYNKVYYKYPPTGERFEMFKAVAKQLGFDFPSEVSYSYEPHQCTDDQCKCLCRVRREILPKLIEKANEIVDRKRSQDLAGSPEEVQRIAGKLRKIVPAANIKTLSDVVNAGWVVYFESKNGKIGDSRFTNKALMDLIAKNFEILAIEYRLGGGVNAAL